MHHPWRGIRALEEWTVVFADLPPGQVGETCYVTQTIIVASWQNQAERRSTMAHELLHATRPVPLESLADKDEHQVTVEAARRLIPFPALLDALRWARTMHELADELWVDQATVRTRLAHLHPSERTKIRAMREECQP